MINPMDLTGKRILVTGASGGMGKETSILLSKLGAKVVMCDMNEESLVDTFSKLEGKGHSWYVFNLNSLDLIDDLIKKIVEEGGPLDGYAHCAGVSRSRPLKMTKPEDIMDQMKPNFFSFVEIVRCLSIKNRLNDESSIVAISSIASVMGKQTKVAYSASKAALDGAIRCLICDLRKKRVRVNSIMPCWVNTRMYQGYIERFTDTFEILEIKEKQYMGVTEPIEVANTIAFLLSDAAKTITGTSILIDGGMSQG